MAQQQQQRKEEESMVKLQSSDNEEFEVKESVVLQAVTIKEMKETIGFHRTIPLPEVKSKTLAKVLEYLNYHHRNPKIGADEQKMKEIQEWDKQFVSMPRDDLFEVIMAANFMSIKDLLGITCQAIADMINGKEPKQIREVLGIGNNFTPKKEEEEAEENAWQFT